MLQLLHSMPAHVSLAFGGVWPRTSFRKFMGTPVLRMRAIWLGELKPAQ